MVSIGTPLAKSATKIMLLGSGELGREVAIEAMRLGIEVIAVDRYANAPAMQVAHRSHVLSMLDANALRGIIERERPDLIVPEIEAIATQTLFELEKEGFRVVPTGKAVILTMNREGIRTLAAEELNLPTSDYNFAGSFEELEEAAGQVGYPCFIKPVMSSSGKGQSVAHSYDDLKKSWEIARTGGRVGGGRVIVEGKIDFDYEITLLTVRHKDGVSFCEPIGHYQEDGDYRLSWQPQPMSANALKKAQEIAHTITSALGGWGVFGVEMFIKGDDVWFSEVSPRPHDTGLVSCISQNLSEFALHARAILGLPIPIIRQYGPSASAVILSEGNSHNVTYQHIDVALKEVDTNIMIFSKPDVHGKRRMGVALALGSTLEEAKRKATDAAAQVKLKL